MNSKRKILIVIDSLLSGWDKHLLKQNNYELLTFGFAPEQAFLDSPQPSNIKLINTEKVSAKAEQDARQIYLELIRDLPNKKIGDSTVSNLLTIDRRNLWWYLRISEKSIWVDKLIHRIYSLLRLVYLCRENAYDEVALFVKDEVLITSLMDFLKKNNIKYRARIPGLRTKNAFGFSVEYFLNNLKLLLKMFLQLLLLRFNGISSVSEIKSNSVGFFSVFPTWWKNPFSQEPSDIFFGKLPKNNINLVWVIPGGKQLYIKRKSIKKFFELVPSVILSQKLRLKDFLSIFSLKRFISVYKLFSAELDFNIDGIDISQIVRDDFLKSLVSERVAEWLLLDKSLKRVDLGKLKSLFFRLEFQPLERAILFNALGKTKTYGFQHSALSNNFINYVFTEKEFEVSGMPLPDRILTTAEIGKNFMEFAGYPTEQIVIIGPLRYKKLFDYAAKKLTKEELRETYGVERGLKVIFIATSSSLSETKGMLFNLLTAVKKSKEKFHLILKYHPNAKGNKRFVPEVESILKDLGKNISNESFLDLSTFYDYLSLSDYIISTGSSVALEAMVLGVMPIIYADDSQFIHNPLNKFADSVVLVRNVAAILQALTNTNVESLLKKWSGPFEYLLDYNKLYSPEKSIRKLKELMEV